MALSRSVSNTPSPARQVAAGIAGVGGEIEARQVVAEGLVHAFGGGKDGFVTSLNLRVGVNQKAQLLDQRPRDGRAGRGSQRQSEVDGKKGTLHRESPPKHEMACVRPLYPRR
ncbi:hypothetical protein GCM10009099_27340 [Caenispirillum bisanense]